MDINAIIASELGIEKWRVDAAVNLLDSGCTVPFVARYRKEATGTMNDEQLRTLSARLVYLRNLEEKKAQVLSSIEEQGKLTAELKKEIEEADTQAALDDLYRPYRPKRRTRASMAKEKGLEPLADLILSQRTNRELKTDAEKYINPDKGVLTAEDALQGAEDIIAETISDDAAIRAWIRQKTERSGEITSEAKDDTLKSVYENYYHFSDRVSRIAGYRVLALNRGEKEKILTVKINAPEDEILQYLERKIIRPRRGTANPYTMPALLETIKDSYMRLIAPAIEREIRNSLTEKAEDGAIEVFGKNLTQLLMQPPIAGKTVLGWDPAFRTGCKLAVVDPTGKVLDTAVVYPTAPTNPAKIAAAKKKVKELISKYHVDLISCGNGTASRESEKIIAEIIKEIPENVSYVITNEAGASVYSASALATEEFPDFDVGQRSAASIARRVQDPLAELVKIDPKAIGVGQYQHDMDQKKLGEKLGGVVEDAVNKVGVDLNTASAPLLTYVSGISKTVAKNVVAHREENGRFTDRRQLLKVPKLGPKAYEQCAGFLRITGGKNPLDSTGVHPESYSLAEKILEANGLDAEKFCETKPRLQLGRETRESLKKEFSVGDVTIDSVIDELSAAGRDPRSEMPAPILRSDVMDMKDLKEGMILKGTVRNIVDFGAFVDIGVHQDGLVHISQMSKDRFIKSPLEAVSVGDIVDVRVLSVDLTKGRISLTMIL